MTFAAFLQVVKLSNILRTNHHSGAKSTPNTPLIFQENS